MGGPTASLVLPKSLTHKQLFELEETINRISYSVEKSNVRFLEFYLEDTSSIGGDFYHSFCCMGVSLNNPGDPDFSDQDECLFIEKHFGFTPQQELQFDAMCNQKQDHRNLALLLIYFAEKYQGIIDFTGALIPHSIEIDYSHHQHWTEVADEVDKWVSAMPGNIWAVEYNTTAERKWAVHISDVEFLRGWLNHPEFHMIK